VLILIILTGIAVVSVQTMLRSDLRLTLRQNEQVKVDYVTESGLNWALAITNPQFRLLTHKSDGVTPADTFSQSTGCGSRAGRMSEKDLNDTFDPLYAQTLLSYDSEGYIVQSTTDRQKSLSKASNEVIKVKIWYPVDSAIAIHAVGQVGSNYDTILFEAKLRSIMKYGLLAQGDIIPFYRKSNGIIGDMYVDGNLYLTPHDSLAILANSIKATGEIITNQFQYYPYGQAKKAFVRDNQSANWKTNFLFPATPWLPASKMRFDEFVWRDVHDFTINGTGVSKSKNWKHPPAAIQGVVEQNGTAEELPDFSPKDPWISDYSKQCDCNVYSIAYTDIAVYSNPAAFRDFIYNPNYGSFKVPGETYAGYYVDDGTAQSWDIANPASVVALRNGSIRFGEYTHRTGLSWWTRRGAVDLYEYMTSINCLGPSADFTSCIWQTSGTTHYWDEHFAGGMSFFISLHGL